ncbi:hypothetical protein [Jiangella gansuensis]|uniref:hypothetical protein n=1 Tax=Jiangella gansuensis TaxID=281473 RepID=UPI0004AD56A7|nr:hypothetical protein [Jiangella gansuensis]
MEAAVLLVFAGLIGAVLVVVRLSRYLGQRRGADLRETARTRGWKVTATAPEVTGRWAGPPFQPGGVARSVVTGQHRGRDFTAFEYLDEARPTPHAKTAIPHRSMVLALALPSAVPELSVARRGAIEATVSRVLDLPAIDTGDDEFDRRFQVTSPDPLFATTVLQPHVVEHLEAHPLGNWRFDGATMIAWDHGRIDPDRLLERLEAAAGLIDRVPAEAWRHPAP